MKAWLSFTNGAAKSSKIANLTLNSKLCLASNKIGCLESVSFFRIHVSYMEILSNSLFRLQYVSLRLIELKDC